ncbi:Citryl-CoA lyase [Deinococcus proteolyticus MRP]|uniref:Citryl-CoA lyase n=1 Tax=Deinococcus proteolyticus (strain ATCC 35074 / DSM 20540 / JCM 6276 / NBRC 101906 / NCIMB 13154 / VKM Ac-1939 / CCM 2703 / MRP) TaxID=693977 RepID=F0RK55_DEIPM|nr:MULTISPECIES: CoA ester lyase [Deinococcus]ADY25614.1 Citryl-CoA lyase [Deinococcus proteolyticus MRP]MCY1701733.1 CoA ester lyase [Deinococcus sp. SL84]
MSTIQPASRRPRSVLFAPAGRADLIAKLPRSQPDAVVIDLEDAVPATPEAKAEARPTAREGSERLCREHPELAVFVRVNSVHSPFFEDDLAALHPTLTGVVVPKLETAVDAEMARDALRERGLTLPILAGLETGAGVWNARSILQLDCVPWAYFGAEDYVTDLGGVRTPGNLEVLYARSQVALAARLTGTHALDIVVTALNDEPRFREDAAQGRSLGYGGKLCIHPAQVTLSNEIFGVSEAQLTRARALLAAAEDAARAGHGAFSFEGQMVDEPMLAAARAVLTAHHSQAPTPEEL